MRNAVIGLIIGIVAGIVLGTTVIAPRLAQNVKQEIGLTAQQNVDAGAEANVETKTAAETEKGTAVAKKAPKKPKVLRLRMASAFPETLAAHGTSAKRLEETLWRISDGTFDLKFHPPGTLVSEIEAVEAVTSGAIDAYFTDIDKLALSEPALTIFAGPPFGVSVQAYLGWLRHGGDALFQDTLSSIGLNGMVCGMVPDAGGGWFKKPLKTVEDFKGMRIRATGVTAKLYQHLGAEVVSFSFAETMIAMEQGLLDGAELSAPHIDVALGAAKSGSTYYLPAWRKPASTFALVMSKETWEGLSEVQKTQLQTVCGDNVAHTIAEAEALQFNALKEITASGADVQPWPAEIQRAVKDAWLIEAKERQKENRLYSKAIKSYLLFIKGQSIWEELARP